jgi:hypothetical protein
MTTQERRAASDAPAFVPLEFGILKLEMCVVFMIAFHPSNGITCTTELHVQRMNRKFPCSWSLVAFRTSDHRALRRLADLDLGGGKWEFWCNGISLNGCQGNQLSIFHRFGSLNALRTSDHSQPQNNNGKICNLAHILFLVLLFNLPRALQL